MSSDLSEDKIDAKKEDIIGNFEVFVLGVGCWGCVVWGGKMHMIRIGFVTDFYGSMLTLKSAIFEVNSRFLCSVLGVGGCWLREVNFIYNASVLSLIFMGQC